MAINVYSSLDTGAPVLTGSLYNRFKQILMACLVNGYGSKPGAGWTIGHQSGDGNGFSLGNGDGFINFVYEGTNGALKVYVMESITDGSTALAAGVNRRSAGWADGSSTSERQTIYMSGGLDSSTNPHWLVVADEKTAIFSFAGGSNTTADVASAYQGTAMYFGRYINTLGISGPAEFISLGGASAQTTSNFGGGSSGMCLRNPFSGVIDQGATPRYGAFNLTYAGGQISDRGILQPFRLLPVRAAVLCYGAGINGIASSGGAAFAGHLRGLISEPALCSSRLSAVLALFGKSNTWQGKLQPISLPNGKSWYPLFANTADCGFFISLDPDDWS